MCYPGPEDSAGGRVQDQMLAVLVERQVRQKPDLHGLMARPKCRYYSKSSVQPLEALRGGPGTSRFYSQNIREVIVAATRMNGDPAGGRGGDWRDLGGKVGVNLYSLLWWEPKRLIKEQNRLLVWCPEEWVIVLFFALESHEGGCSV